MRTRVESRGTRPIRAPSKEARCVTAPTAEVASPCVRSSNRRVEDDGAYVEAVDPYEGTSADAFSHLGDRWLQAPVQHRREKQVTGT